MGIVAAHVQVIGAFGILVDLRRRADYRIGSAVRTSDLLLSSFLFLSFTHKVHLLFRFCFKYIQEIWGGPNIGLKKFLKNF